MSEQIGKSEFKAGRRYFAHGFSNHDRVMVVEIVKVTEKSVMLIDPYSKKQVRRKINNYNKCQSFGYNDAFYFGSENEISEEPKAVKVENNEKEIVEPEIEVAEDVEVVVEEQGAEADTLTVENAHTAYTVEDKAHPEYGGFKRFNYQDQPMNDGKKPLSSIGTVPLVVGKRFLFEAEGQSPRQMCVVKDCPLPTSGVSWMSGYAIADYMSGFTFPCSSHDATEKEAIEDFLARMRELKIRPDDIASAVKRFKPEDAKWSTVDLSALPCVVKMHIKQAYGICL